MNLYAYYLSHDTIIGECSQKTFTIAASFADVENKYPASSKIELIQKDIVIIK